MQIQVLFTFCMIIAERIPKVLTFRTKHTGLDERVGGEEEGEGEQNYSNTAFWNNLSEILALITML